VRGGDGGGRPQVIPNQEGLGRHLHRRLHRQGERLVGQIAKRQALTNPKNTVFACQAPDRTEVRVPGIRGGAQVPALPARRGSERDVHIQIEDKVYSPPEISSFVLQKLKAAAEDYSGVGRGSDHHRPRLLQRPQRQATKDAASSPGSRSRASSTSRRRRRSPTASRTRARAAVRGGVRPRRGHLDITILEMADGLFQVRRRAATPTSGARTSTADHQLADRGVPEGDGDRPHPGPHGPPAPQGGGGEGEVRAQHRAADGDRLPFISADASGPKHSTPCSPARSTRS